jgi:hypothetical protein
MIFEVQDPTEIEELLTLLDGALSLENESRPIELLVCGGAALLALGLTERATHDIDVLALVEDGRDVAAKPFPAFLTGAVERVARDRQLPDDWVNPGPADMQQWGLPAGCLERAVRTQYGEYLSVWYLDRLGQIHLKLYAAVDQSGGKHLSDLKAIEPTAQELEQAARWCQTHDPSQGFQMLLVDFLSHIGFSDVASEL